MSLHVDYLDGWVGDIERESDGWQILVSAPGGRQWRAARTEINAAVIVAGRIVQEQREEMAMQKQQLLTRDDRLVTEVMMPPFDPKPEVVVWGDRHFIRRDDGRYLEGMAWYAVDKPKVASG